MKSRVGFVALAALIAPVASVGQPVTLVSSGANMTIPTSLESKRRPVWGGNALVLADGPPGEPTSFQAFDRHGVTVFNTPFSIPEAVHTYVHSYARGSDGTLVVCGSSYMGDGRGAPFVAWISPDDPIWRVIRTEPYRAELIAAAPDGTLWTVGRELNSALSEKSGVDLEAGVVRHFDRSGKRLGSFIPRSSIPNTALLANTNGYLAVSSAGHVAWLSFLVGGEGAYIEISPGGEITRYPLPGVSKSMTALMINGIAMTETGDVFASVMSVNGTDRNSSKSHSVFRLDRAEGRWSVVAISPKGISTDWAALYGASGSNLVIWLREDPPSTLRFLAARR